MNGRRAEVEQGDLFVPGRASDRRGEPVHAPIPTTPAPAEPESPANDAPEVEAPQTRPSLFFDGPFREFEYNGGVHLTDSVLWCDADRRHDLTFISHAHENYLGKSRRALATDKTVQILTRGTGKIEALTSPYRRSFKLGPLQLELHPAGHVLGAAQLLIIRGGRRIVYTNDINIRKTLTVEHARPVPCDVLAVPATYGLPTYRFPEREAVLADIRAFVDAALEDRATPVLIANQIGTSQELICALGRAGYRLRVHRSIYDVAKIYKQHGVSLPNTRRFQGTPARDEVVIFPPILRRHASIRKLRKYHTAIVSGKAVDPGFAGRHRVDAAFPLSDTADHADLLRFIKETGAREVFLFSGYVEEFAQELTNLGIKAFSLVKPRQLALF